MPARPPAARSSHAEIWSHRSAMVSSRNSFGEDPMVTLGVSVLVLQTAVFVGIAVSMFWYERSLLSPGGVVVPGYVALFLLLRPEVVAYTLAIALTTAALMRYASRFTILFGRRRFAVTMLAAMSLSIAIELIVGPFTGLDPGFQVIGFIIPGLIANEVLRQKIIPTLSTLGIVSGDDARAREPQSLRRRSPRAGRDQEGRPVHGPAPCRGVDLAGGRGLPPPLRPPECRQRFARRRDPGPREPLVRAVGESGRPRVCPADRFDLEKKSARQRGWDVRRRPEPELRVHVGRRRIRDVDERSRVSRDRPLFGTGEPGVEGMRPRAPAGPLDLVSQCGTMDPLSLVVHAIADRGRRPTQQLRRRDGGRERIPGAPGGSSDPREPGQQRRLAVCNPGRGPVHVRGRPRLQLAEREQHRSCRPQQRGAGAARIRDGPRPPELAVRHRSSHPGGLDRGRGGPRPWLRGLRPPVGGGGAGGKSLRECGG